MPALIAASVGLSDVDSISDSGDSDSADSSTNPTAQEPDLDVTRSEVLGAAGFVIAFSALAMLLVLLLIIVRFCNIGLVNIKIKVFLIIVSSKVRL